MMDGLNTLIVGIRTSLENVLIDNTDVVKA